MNNFTKASMFLLIPYFTIILITLAINEAYVIPVVIGWTIGLISMATLAWSKMI